MKPRTFTRWIATLATALAIAWIGQGCGGMAAGGSSNTNWLHDCDSDRDCSRSGLSCVCGVCTRACDVGDCRDLSRSATCVTPSSAAARACGAETLGALCTVACAGDGDCRSFGRALQCVGGACLVPPRAARDAGVDSTTNPPRRDASVLPPDATGPGHDPADAGLDAADAGHPPNGAGHHASDAGHDASDAGHHASTGSTRTTAEDFRYNDRTGRITINVRTCAPIVMVPEGDEASCGTPDDFVLIGGGVEILNDPDDPGAGAVLARSAPSSECVLWAASWIDLDPEHPVKGRAYSISIRFASQSRPGAYISADSVREARSCISHKYFADGGSGVAEVPSTAYQLVGGGVANLDSTGLPAPPVAIVQSYPSDEYWHGKGINLQPEVADIQFRVFSIGLLKFIPDFGYINVQFGGSTFSCGLGHLCASTDMVSPSTGVVTCIGGTALYGGAGRYLSGLVPLVQKNGHISAGSNLMTRDFINNGDVGEDDPMVANQSALLILNASE